MPLDIAGSKLSGGTNLLVTDASNNQLFQQDSGGRVLAARDSSGATRVPLFAVGVNAGSWVSYAASSWNTLTPGYTGGDGYLNVGGCYNTTNGRFTAPWTGMYLIQQSFYIYGNSSTVDWYVHPMFNVNGSTNLRRGNNTIYRIRGHGIPASYANDTDCCELMYLTAGDYVEIYHYSGGSMQYYGGHSQWSGVYMGS